MFEAPYFTMLKYYSGSALIIFKNNYKITPLFLILQSYLKSKITTTI